jgi:hypothetical protein
MVWGAGGSVYVDPGFHHGVDDGIDLLFGGFLLHCYDHCLFPVSGAPRAPKSVALPMVRPGRSLRSQLVSLQGSHHVDDALVDMRQLDVRQRALVGRAHVGVDHLFARRLVDRQRCGGTFNWPIICAARARSLSSSTSWRSRSSI